MNEIELTQLFVEYAETDKRLKELGKQIEAEILIRGETSKIAGVKATYYAPSTETPDYEEIASSVMPSDYDLTPYTTVTTNVKWKEVCYQLDVYIPPGNPKPARVVIKV